MPPNDGLKGGVGTRQPAPINQDPVNNGQNEGIGYQAAPIPLVQFGPPNDPRLGENRPGYVIREGRWKKMLGPR